MGTTWLGSTWWCSEDGLPRNVGLPTTSGSGKPQARAGIRTRRPRYRAPDRAAAGGLGGRGGLRRPASPAPERRSRHPDPAPQVSGTGPGSCGRPGWARWVAPPSVASSDGAPISRQSRRSPNWAYPLAPDPTPPPHPYWYEPIPSSDGAPISRQSRRSPNWAYPLAPDPTPPPHPYCSSCQTAASSRLPVRVIAGGSDPSDVPAGHRAAELGHFASSCQTAASSRLPVRVIAGGSDPSDVPAGHRAADRMSPPVSPSAAGQPHRAPTTSPASWTCRPSLLTQRHRTGCRRR